jgi:hypothetical protein
LNAMATPYCVTMVSSSLPELGVNRRS